MWGRDSWTIPRWTMGIESSPVPSKDLRIKCRISYIGYKNKITTMLNRMEWEKIWFSTGYSYHAVAYYLFFGFFYCGAYHSSKRYTHLLSRSWTEFYIWSSILRVYNHGTPGNSNRDTVFFRRGHNHSLPLSLLKGSSAKFMTDTRLYDETEMMSSFMEYTMLPACDR